MKTNIIITIAILAIIIAFYFIGDKLLKEVLGNKDGKGNTVKDADKDVNKNELSKSNSWYSQSADNLFESFEGAGTDEAAVFHIMKQLENKSDWNMLVSKFGMRGDGYIFSDESLIEWIKSELSDSDLEKLRRILERIDVHVI